MVLGHLCPDLKKPLKVFSGFERLWLGPRRIWLGAGIGMSHYVIKYLISTSNSYNLEMEILSSMSFSYFSKFIIFRFRLPHKPIMKKKGCQKIVSKKGLLFGKSFLSWATRPITHCVCRLVGWSVSRLVGNTFAFSMQTAFSAPA